MGTNLRTIAVVFGLVLIAGAIQNWPPYGLAIALVLAVASAGGAMLWDAWHPAPRPQQEPQSPVPDTYWRG